MAEERCFYRFEGRKVWKLLSMASSFLNKVR